MTTAQSLSTVVFSVAHLSVIATVIEKPGELMAEIVKLLREAEVIDSDSEVEIRLNVLQVEGPLQIITEAIIEPNEGERIRFVCSLLLGQNQYFDIRVEIFKEAPASTKSPKPTAVTEATDNWHLMSIVEVPVGEKDDKWKRMMRRIFSDLEVDSPDTIKSEK